MKLDEVHSHIMGSAKVNESQLYDVVRLIRKMGIEVKERGEFENLCEEKWRGTL